MDSRSDPGKHIVPQGVQEGASSQDVAHGLPRLVAKHTARGVRQAPPGEPCRCPAAVLACQQDELHPRGSPRPPIQFPRDRCHQPLKVGVIVSLEIGLRPHECQRSIVYPRGYGASDCAPRRME